MTDSQKLQQIVLLLRVLNKILRRKGKRKAGGTRSQRKKAKRARASKRQYARRVARNRKIILCARTQPCADCGLFYGAECMEFDHRDGEKKAGCVGDFKYALTRLLLAEIAKCSIVCCECHEKREIARGRDHGRRGPSQCPNVAKRGIVQARPV